MSKRSVWFAVVIALVTAVLVTAFIGCSATQRTDGGEGLLPIGSVAPDVFASDQHGKIQRLSDEKGHPVVVYFYPKDATPGCTKEACAFRDNWDRFKQANVQVFGVSTDDRPSHEKFAQDQKLPFPILADPDQVWVRAFGVPTKLGMASRVTFLIGPEGKVAKVYPEVDPALHANEVLADAAALTPSAPAEPSPEATAPATAAPTTVQ